MGWIAPLSEFCARTDVRLCQRSRRCFRSQGQPFKPALIASWRRARCSASLSACGRTRKDQRSARSCRLPSLANPRRRSSKACTGFPRSNRSTRRTAPGTSSPKFGGEFARLRSRSAPCSRDGGRFEQRDQYPAQFCLSGGPSQPGALLLAFRPLLPYGNLPE